MLHVCVCVLDDVPVTSESSIEDLFCVPFHARPNRGTLVQLTSGYKRKEGREGREGVGGRGREGHVREGRNEWKREKMVTHFRCHTMGEHRLV